MKFTLNCAARATGLFLMSLALAALPFLPPAGDALPESLSRTGPATDDAGPRFLFELMASRGIPLHAGQWISTGAVTGVHDALPGQLVEARFADDLWIACKFTEARRQGGI